MPPAFILKLRERFASKADRNVVRIQRRQVLTALLWKSLPSLTSLLLVVGYLWMLVIPSPRLGQKTYIDENALQPGQVHTYWNWDDVHRADNYLAQLERLRDDNSTSEEIATFITGEFGKLGISASTQRYSFTTTAGAKNGTNSYAVFSSPRASGTEAMVISASWLSRTGDGDGTLNLRGVSTVLSLAAFLKGYSLWAKDLIFVVSDGYLDGMQAWITAYHGAIQSNLQAEPLTLPSGVIWTALNIDYPGHSFSHLGVFFEGLNGRLPNQDLINSFYVVAQHTGGVPLVVYDHLDPREFPGRQDELSIIPTWVPEPVKQNKEVNEYAARMKNVLRHVSYQARGQASGVHGLLHQFRIDAITLFAVPAVGPHGFHSIGRIVESTLRTTNNLLERLHASFFFYLLVGTTTFLKIGSFLPSVILISVSLMFGGLREWVNAGWIWIPEIQQTIGEKDSGEVPSRISGTWSRRSRPVLKALSIMLCTHALGAVLFYAITRPWFVRYQPATSTTLLGLVLALPLGCLSLSAPPATQAAPLPVLLKSLNLCFTSTVLSIISLLNFSLAATLAILLGLPLHLSSSAPRQSLRLTKYAFYQALGFGWLVLGREETRRAIVDWEVLGVWFVPFVCVVYAPLVLQAAIVCILPS
ncbi:Gaa1-domain-containing protein [Amylocystis lapponica]|nr:Gaa1-domain-containing protein [Amylocystis lapponica]